MIETRPFPRFMICAPSSGSGKTLITCALLRILVRKGYLPASYKCGPDYIDPMFHSKVLGIPSRNLDVFLMGKNGVKGALDRGAAGRNIGVLEGVMGLYDGIAVDSEEGSSYHISSITETPIILVVNCKGMSRSIIPLVKGFCDYDKEKLIAGLILNNISEMVAGKIKKEIEDETHIPVIGIMPKLSDVKLESRHLGLVMPGEIPELLSTIDKVADALEKSLDLDMLMKVAKKADEIAVKDASIQENPTGISRNTHKIKVGIAMDEAFSFYYEDNLDMLKDLGAELIFFSPIHDKRLPDVSRLIIGGGYPELKAKELSENKAMREEILLAAKSGMPILAECGGFLYLQKSLADPYGKEYEMVGLFEGKGSIRNKLHHFGYVSMTAEKDNRYLFRNEEIQAHEFHYYDTTCNGDVCLLKKKSGVSWSGYQTAFNCFGGFAHLYYPSNPDFIKRFMEC